MEWVKAVEGLEDVVSSMEKEVSPYNYGTLYRARETDRAFRELLFHRLGECGTILRKAAELSTKKFRSEHTRTLSGLGAEIGILAIEVGSAYEVSPILDSHAMKEIVKADILLMKNVKRLKDEASGLQVKIITSELNVMAKAGELKAIADSIGTIYRERVKRVRGYEER